MKTSYNTYEPCVYLIKEPDSSFYKIGRTGNLKSRISAINTSRSASVSIVEVVYTKNAYSAKLVEQDLHQRLREFRVNREWFNLPNMEIWKQALENALPLDGSIEPVKPLKMKAEQTLDSIKWELPKPVPTIAESVEVPILARCPKAPWTFVRWKRNGQKLLR